MENDAKLNKKQNRIDNSHILKNTITWQGSIQNAKLTDSNKDKDDVNEMGFDEHFEFENVQKIPVVIKSIIFLSYLSKSIMFSLIQIVGAGLRSLYELISDTRIDHPQLCSKALQALFDILQGIALNIKANFRLVSSICLNYSSKSRKFQVRTGRIIYIDV